MKHIKKASMFMSSYKITTFVMGFSALYLVFVIRYGLDVFEGLHLSFHEMLLFMERFEGDALLLVLVFILMAWFFDLVILRAKERREHEMDQQRMRVMRATMATVQDVVNNFLNNLQLFRFEAEQSQALQPEHLQQFDELIKETAHKIKSINALERFAECEVCEGMTALKIDANEREKTPN